jgi:hypothetical protein
MATYFLFTLGYVLSHRLRVDSGLTRGSHSAAKVSIASNHLRFKLYQRGECKEVRVGGDSENFSLFIEGSHSYLYLRAEWGHLATTLTNCYGSNSQAVFLLSVQ